MEKKLMDYPEFASKDVDIVERQVLHQGYFRMARYHLRHRLFAGGWSEEISRELFEQKHAVGVLLYDPDLAEVVLVEQFRVGALMDEQSPWLVEIVAGAAKPEEDLMDVARREAMEEAGLEILDLIPVSNYWVSPGITSERIIIYCGKVDAREAGGLHGLAHEHEDIRVRSVAIAEAFAGVREGVIRNAAAIIALQWLELNLQKLNEAWLSKK